jgi:hypothetical protein
MAAVIFPFAIDFTVGVLLLKTTSGRGRKRAPIGWDKSLPSWLKGAEKNVSCSVVERVKGIEPTSENCRFAQVCWSRQLVAARLN